MTNIKLNKRLEVIAFLVPNGAKVLDVGCDHALLDIYLVKENREIVAVGSDVKEGPLEKARENIKKYQVEGKIELRLGDGIETIDEKIDTIVISGMGGLNMVGILKYKTHLLKNVQRIILSPNNYQEFTRREIVKLGFFIKDEYLVEENNIIYQIIVFEKGKARYKKHEYLYGPVLLKKQDELFMKHIKKELKQKEMLLKILPKKYFKKRFILQNEIKSMKKMLQEKEV